MKPDRPNRLQSPVKAAISSLAIFVVAIFAVPEAQGRQQSPPGESVTDATTGFAVPYPWRQQKPDGKNQPAEKKKPEAQKPSQVKKTPELPHGLRAVIEIGGEDVELRGDRPGKFQEYRDYPRSFFMRNLLLNFESASSPFILSLKAREIREQDQRYSAEVWKVGKFHTQFLWDQIPHYYSDGSTFDLRRAPGDLAVDPALRASLQAAIPLLPNANGPPLGPTSIQLRDLPQYQQLLPLVRQAVQFGPGVNLRLRSDQLLVTQSYHPNENWELYFRVQQLHLNGTRPKPTGTFERAGLPAPNQDGVWEAQGVELAEPVKYQTTNLTFGLEYSRPKWRVGVDYFLSRFRNSIPALTWENPFRLTPSLANPGFGTGRNRYVQAQQALPPENDYQSVNVHAGVDLPHETQLRGAFTWGRGTQNQPFLPYTLNSALTAANLTPLLPAGATACPQNTSGPNCVPALFGLALPQPSLGGEVRTLNHDYALASRPWKNMRFLLQYRSDDKDNRSSQITFPGLPSFGDSSVRTSADFYNRAIENFPTSYKRQNTTATWQWEVSKSLSWELEYDWEIWNRRFFEAPRTNEHSLHGRLNYRPTLGVALKADYLYADRKPTCNPAKSPFLDPCYPTQPLTFNQNLTVPGLPSGGGPGWEVTLVSPTQPTNLTIPFVRGVPLEFNRLRRFDDDKRMRKDGGLSLEVTRWQQATFSASYRYLRDDYDKGARNNPFYGLHYDVLSTVDAQFTYFLTPAQKDDQQTNTPPTTSSWKGNTFFYANYSREQQQIGYLGLGHLIIGAVQDVRACCGQYPINNTWLRSSSIHLDMFQFGINHASEGERTVVDLSYVLAFARDKTSTANPFTVLDVSHRTAGAINYPDVINRQQEVNFFITRRLRPGLDLGLSYRFEPYRLDDYYTNNLQPYQVQMPLPGPAQLSVARPDITSPTPRYLFLNARFTTYHANVATIFLRYTFGL